MSDGVTLRAANHGDAPAVLAMVRAYQREEHPAAPFSLARAQERFEECLARGAVIVSTVDDAPIATCGVLTEELPLSDAQWLRMVWCYVRPAHRRAPHMRELLRTARAIGRSTDLPLRAECETGERLQGKLGLFRRELGDHAGATFLVRS